MSFENAFITVSNLVNDFKENKKVYLSTSYSEADVRNDFINKFFIALGWDVRHDEQKNPYEQEVRVEKPVQVAKAQKRADYTFYLSPNYRDVKFFVEAKKPYHDLENKDYFFQTVRYGWNANTPVALLTDFEEFIILDCRFRPDINEILNYKIKSFTFDDYANEEKFKEIYFLFSREAVADNSIEKFTEALPKPKGKKKALVKESYQKIDEAFLTELDAIRTTLAKSFKKNNAHLTSEELTEATQRTIDRLVFIKFLEDKMIEPHHYVSEFVKPHPVSLSLQRRGTKGEVGLVDKVESNKQELSAWEKFLRASRTLDAKYNGVVFKKSLIDSRNIVEPEDKTFSSICEGLSYDNTPYNFDAIPIHILGSIYERFLGKVVNATDKRVTIDEKPEVRKAGGVYYTPQYIVNYIVDNTIVKLIAGDRPFGKGKTPKEIAKMRFADIACGSGSFLITVYERILDYHKRWYLENPEQAKKDGCILFEGAYRLSLQQKQKILTNNIYGVDLDQQAVEVTQLSLYLKLLEDETTATANDTWVMFKEQILPDLNKNIICGNSLIGTDILNPTLILPFSKGEETGGPACPVGRVNELKLKPMDFENVFPHIFKSSPLGGVEGAGGFDAVVGNPPYLYSAGKRFSEYFKTHFKFNQYQTDYYVYFIERALSLIKNKGKFSYIISDSWLNSDYFKKMRDELLLKHKIEKLIVFDYPVFQNVTLENSIIIISVNEKPSSFDIIRFNSPQKYIIANNLAPNDAYAEGIIKPNKSTITDYLINKIENDSKPLSHFCKINRGIHAYRTDGYGKSKFGGGHQTKKDKELQSYHSDKPIDKTYLPEIKGKDVFKYSFNYSGKYLSYGDWLAEPRTPEYFMNPKVVLRKILGDKIIGTFISEPLAIDQSLYILIVEKNEEAVLKTFLGLLSSRLAAWYLKNKYSIFDTLYPWFTIKQLSTFPTKIIDNKLHSLADQMLTTKKQLQQAKTESDINYLQRKCETIDRQIDQLVYGLYGLTEEEIKIVEGASNP
ncbi:MAG: N-6 DNA methylase [Ignavibacteriales bacterium]|nr:N-6 DNA methylase [Ignavibacteriales bacterium]